MKKLLLIDGNSIMNRAFYGIMGSKVLTTSDGKYTNAVYGFLAIMFKEMETIEPNYMAVSFDLKAPTKRHEMYKEYKANRHGMPKELAEQMPMIKEILNAMKIDIIEKEGYEGDDILGTIAKYGEEQNLKVYILSGDRDTFQLASKRVTIRIPHTKGGKTETDEYNREKIIEKYGIEPKQLIEVKGLQGDTSDNIPGVPGVGNKTALTLIQKFGSIENLYKAIDEETDELKGKSRSNIIENRELAFLSKELGTINVNVPLSDSLEELKVEEWDKEKVLEIFKELKFKRFIERFNLEGSKEAKENVSSDNKLKDLFKIEEIEKLEKIYEKIKENKKIIFYFEHEDNDDKDLIIKKKISAISIYFEEENTVYYARSNSEDFYKYLKLIFEDNNIEKYGYKLTQSYILLRQNNIIPTNLKFDVEVAAYIIDPTKGKYPIDNLCEEYLKITLEDYLAQNEIKQEQNQMTLFDTMSESVNVQKYVNSFYVYCIWNLAEKLNKKIKRIGALNLFNEIDMPTVEVLSDMQWNGIKVDYDKLEEFGNSLKDGISLLTQDIYNIAGEEFNINSPKQMGEILFDKMKLPVIKKTKSGYSTAEDVLEKLKKESPIIEKILEYRQLSKLNSTYVEGIKPYINPKTGRIHSFFHQTITATGRISSTEPNLQNIPTRIEFGKRLRKVFNPEEGKIYIDADYSQIELRVLAHLSNDEHMIRAFKNGEDIHKQAAAMVLHKNIEDITKEERSSAKAVNFGIVYGISEFGLGEQLGIGRKEAKKYIESYLEEYAGINKFMKESIETAKEKGYASTIFNRRRYIKELSSNNYMVRQFGERAAMNTPVQGTAADIMKIAMIKVYKALKEKNLKTKIILQVHDEMMLEAPIEEKEVVKKILKTSMESATELKVPLVADISEADNWYNCK